VLNWGDVSSLRDLYDLVARKSYGTGRLVSTLQYAGGSAHQRVGALCASFGLIGGILTLAGAIGAFRWRRWYFWFELLAFGFSGPAFVAYANLNLDAPSAYFVLQRFFLLSHVLTAPLVSLGLLFLVSMISKEIRPVLVAAAAAIAVAAAAALSLPNYRRIDQSRNHIARNYAQDILKSVPPGAILLAGGDEAVLPLLYLQVVEKQRPDVSMIITPLLPGDWYVAQVRRRFPQLSLPFRRMGGRAGTSRQLIDANRNRTIAVVGDVPDKTWDGHYWFYQHGLVTIVQPMDKDVKLSVMTAENEALLRSFDIPPVATVNWDTFETGIMARYATPAYRLGQENETAHRYDQAKGWYRRAVDIDPRLQLAVDALARVSQRH
jgi:hypothetical protein